MIDLSWLVGRRVEKVVRNDFNWDFALTGNVNLRAECLWRLLESGHIVATSADHGQQFGLPAPLDCVIEVSRRIANAAVTAVRLREDTLDLAIDFPTCTLEIIPDSSGYEAWQVGGCNMLAIAVGGGRIDVFRDQKSDA